MAKATGPRSYTARSFGILVSRDHYTGSIDPLKTLLIAFGTLLIALFAVSALQGNLHPSAFRADAATSACSFPASLDENADLAAQEKAAWEIFVAANCTVGNQRTWETWVEQSDFYPTGRAGLRAAVHRHVLHASPLAAALKAAKHHGGVHIQSASTGCDPSPIDPLPPFFDPAKGTICEETRMNPETVAFMTEKGNQFQNRSGQATAAAKSVDIQFPTASIEVKVDWIPSSAFLKRYQFSCTNPPAGLHVEQIGTECYVMAGMHVESKLLKNWLWATFEPQNLVTNPGRCITYRPCQDSWGSNPPTSNGGDKGDTDRTAPLKALMAAAALPKEFENYRLVGVQTLFGTKTNPTILGNSVIEGENAGVPAPNGASCITCHSLSMVRTDGSDSFTSVLAGAKVVTDNGKPLGGERVGGPQFAPPKGWILRDFVWSMSIACPETSPVVTGFTNGRCQ